MAISKSTWEATWSLAPEHLSWGARARLDFVRDGNAPRPRPRKNRPAGKRPSSVLDGSDRRSSTFLLFSPRQDLGTGGGFGAADNSLMRRPFGAPASDLQITFYSPAPPPLNKFSQPLHSSPWLAR